MSTDIMIYNTGVMSTDIYLIQMSGQLISSYQIQVSYLSNAGVMSADIYLIQASCQLIFILYSWHVN